MNPLRSARSAVARHRTRHRPSGFDICFADRIACLNLQAWNELVTPHSVFMSPRYLKVIERNGPENIVGRYAMVYCNDEPLAAIAAQRVAVNFGHFGRPATSRKRRAVRKMTKPLDGIVQHMLVCGNLMSWGNHGIAISPRADESIIGGIAEALYRIRRADVLLGGTDFVMVKDVTPEFESLATGLRTYSYRRLETDPNMVLHLKPQWKSLDEYLAALTSTYRKSARKVLRDIEAAGITLQRIVPDESNVARLHDLYLQVHDAAAVRLFTLPESFFTSLAHHLVDDFICTAAIKNDQIVGFITSVKDGSTAVAYYIGFDRALNAELPLYFRLLYAAVEDAIWMGCERISFGRTALEPKARLGAKPEPMAVYVRHRMPMLNLVVKAAVKGVHHDDAPDRNPFKTE